MDSRTINEHYAEIGAELIENEEALESIRESGATIIYLSSEYKKTGNGKVVKAFFVSYVLISRELIPEQCVVVNKLILPSLFLFAWLIESANETALLQFLKDNLEISSLRYLRRRCNLFARGAVWPPCQRLDDGKMYPRMTEKRREQLRILKA